MSDTAIGVPGKGTRVSGHTIQARRDPELENGERDAPPLEGRGETIDALVESFQRLAVAVPVPDLGAPFDAAWATSATRTTRAQVRVPYWNNKYVKEVGGVSLPAPPGFDASVRGDALDALGVGENEAVAVGKGRPDEIAGLVTRAIAAGLIRIGYAPVSDDAYWAAGWRPAIEAWLLRVGIGVDCSGFVYQALHTLLRRPGEQTTHDAGGRNGILDSYPNEDVGRTIASDELMSEQGNPVSPPDELAVADIMYITDHIRIIMAVQRSADATEFVTAESTADGRYRERGAINGPRIHFWRYRGATLEHRYEDSTEWLASGETPVYRRHLGDAPAVGADAATGSGGPLLRVHAATARTAAGDGHTVQRQEDPGGGGIAPDADGGGSTFDVLLGRIARLFRAAGTDQPSLDELRPPVGELVAWCRDHLPDRAQVESYVGSRAPREDKIAVLGALGHELTRMELMLGGLYNGAPSGTNWRADDTSAALFPGTYLAAAQVGTDLDWCTAFAGFGFGRLGAHPATFGSGLKQRERGAVVFPQTSWMILHHLVAFWTADPARQGVITSIADLVGGFVADAAGVLDTLDPLPADGGRSPFEQHLYNAGADRLVPIMKDRQVPTSAPRPGDLLILNTRGPATGTNDDHTAMIDRYEFPALSTIEGNLGNTTGGRQLDLTDPAHLGSIYFVSRPAQQLVDASATAGTGDASAGDAELASVQEHNRRQQALFARLTAPATE